MEEKEVSLEKEAQILLANGELEGAQQLLKQAALTYRQEKNYRQAALCFSSAASIWGQVYGDTSYYASAELFEEAAKSAEKYFDYDYAYLQYRYAAINYERDREFYKFSDCFYHSKECRRKHLFQLLHKNKKQNVQLKLSRLMKWLAMSFSCLIWGYGEKPFRTMVAGLILVLTTASLYMVGGLAQNGVPFEPSFFEALYFSVSSITPMGYGGLSSVGLSRPVAMLEASIGVFLVPLFLVGLTRRYLRV